MRIAHFFCRFVKTTLIKAIFYAHFFTIYDGNRIKVK